MSTSTPTKLTSLLLLLLSPLPVCSQEPDSNTLSIKTQLITRGEWRHGGVTAKSEKEIEDRAAFVTGRTRIGADYGRKNLSASIVAQHSGVWGESGKGSFNIYEAWARLQTEGGLFAKLGRQELAYDDERIIGSNDWAMAASSHDVLKLGYETGAHKVHAILAYNQNAESVNGGSYYVDGAQPYKTMHTLWYHFDMPNAPLGLSALFMNIGMESGNSSKTNHHTRWQQLAGAYIKFQPQHWQVEASYYRQFGHNEYNIPIQAWMTSVKTTFTPSTRYSLRAGYDYLSGDKDFATPSSGDIGLARHTKIHGFNPVYGSHHKFYGAMDFFYVTTYYGGFTPGLQNLYAGATWQPLAPLSLKADYHYMATATSLANANRSLGHQLELGLSYQVTKDVTASLGYSYMHGTRTMEILKRSTHRHTLQWAWASIAITPNLITTKW
ncbi:MAG: alginate export family protein [Bacteroidaceae bacterium]|jgi:opacity protein-like surface antigen|nr:alginate export family protein [Bacteroidaceae bacterium]